MHWIAKDSALRQERQRDGPFQLACAALTWGGAVVMLVRRWMPAFLPAALAALFVGGGGRARCTAADASNPVIQRALPGGVTDTIARLQNQLISSGGLLLCSPSLLDCSTAFEFLQRHDCGCLPGGRRPQSVFRSCRAQEATG